MKSKINERENRKIIEKINENKSQSFGKINTINETLARVIREKKKKTKLTNIRNKRGQNTNPQTLER